jgi:hypothetical protein
MGCPPSKEPESVVEPYRIEPACRLLLIHRRIVLTCIELDIAAKPH